MSEFSDEQLEAGIANAIAAHDFPAVIDMLRVLAVQNPSRAETVLAAINVGLALAEGTG